VDDGQAAFQVQTDVADGNYGSFSIDADGNWDYVLNNDHIDVQSLTEGETLTRTITVTSADGTATHNITITIVGANDAADITVDLASGDSDSGIVTEDGATDLDGNTVEVVSGTLTISDVDDGQAVFQVQTDVADSNYGSFSIDADGNWDYVLNNDHIDVQSLTEGETLTRTITVTSADGTATHNIIITIVGANDPADITVDLASGDSDSGIVTEDGATDLDGNTVEVVSGTLTISDVDDGQAVFQVQTDVADSNYGSFSIDADGNWDYVLNNDHIDVQSLTEGETLTRTITVTSADGTATHNITITIVGANDPADITVDLASGDSDSGMVTEDGASDVDGNTLEAVSGTLTISDVDNGQAAFQVQTDVADGNYGSFSIDADGNWDYVLNNDHIDVQSLTEGETLTRTITVTSADGTATHNITITIVGANDPADITVDLANGDSDSATVTEDGASDVDGNTLEAVSGTLTISDVDNGQAAFQVQTDVADGNYGSFSIDADGNWDYVLNNDHIDVQSLTEGETLTRTITVTSADGTATHNITITIVGANDPADITVDLANGDSDSATVTEDGTSDADSNTVEAVSGTLTISDVDDGQAAFQVQTDVADGNYGSFSIDADGNWDYVLNNDHIDVQSLTEGETLTRTITVTSADGTATHNITITIVGANDPADITVDLASGDSDSGMVTEDGTSDVDGNTIEAVSGTLSISDVDDGQAAFQVQTDVADGNYGSFSIDADGNWDYVLNNDHIDVQSLTEGETLTRTITVTSADGTATHNITITIVGANDAADITVDLANGDSDSATVTEDGASDADGNTVEAVSGTFTISDVDDGQAAFQVQTDVADSNYGSFSIDADGNWDYVLNNDHIDVQSLTEGETLTRTITVTSADGTVTHNITITIVGANDPADITVDLASGDSDSGMVTEDGATDVDGNTVEAVSGTLSMSDVDDGQAAFQVQTDVADGNYGSFSIDADGSWDYVLNNDHIDVQSLTEGETLTRTITVTSADGTATHNITITIVGTNDAPEFLSGSDIATDIANNDSYDFGSILEGTLAGTVVGQVFANDKDTNDTLTFSFIDGSLTNGVFTINKDTGEVTVNIDIDDIHIGSYALDIKVTDSNGAEDTAKITINLENVDDPTQTNNDDKIITEDTIAQGNVLSNDTDPDNNLSVVSFTITGDSTVYTADSTVMLDGGLLELNSDGSYRFTPTQHWNGVLPVIVYLTNTGATATLTITVTPENDQPQATDNQYIANDSQTVTGNLLTDDTGIGLDNDIDNDSLTITHINGSAIVFIDGEATVNVTGGTLLINQDGSFTFTHDTSTTSIPDIQYTISDGNGLSDTATLTLNYNNVDAENDGAQGASYNATANFTSGVSIPVDADNNPLFSIRALTYDNAGKQIEGVISTVNGNGIGVDGSIRPDGQVSTQIEFDPTTGLSESIELQFNELVNYVEFSVAKLYADENAAEQGVWKAYYNGELVSSGIFSNESGDTGSFIIDTDDIVFDTLVFEATNNASPVTSGDSSDYVLTSINASGANLGQGAIITGEDNILTVSDPNAGLLANDSDAQNNDFSITAINHTSVTNGSTITLDSGALLTIYSDGTYLYNPNNAFNSLTAGQVTQDTFTYTVTDDNGATDTATVVINIIGASDAPITYSDNFSIDEGELINLTGADFVSDDVDVEGHAITLMAFATDITGNNEIDAAIAGNTLTTTLGGIITINADGSYSYQAPSNIDHSSGDVTDSFYYQAGNGYQNSPWTQVIIDVQDTTPTAENDRDHIGFGGTAYGNVITGAGTNGNGIDDIGADITELTSIEIDGITYDSFDADGNITVTIADSGTLIINKNGSYTFASSVPEINGQASVTDTIFYTLTDADGNSAQARLRIVQDSTPDAKNDVDSVNEAGLSSGTAANNGSNITTGNLLDNDEGISGTTTITQIDGVAAVNGVITITNSVGTLVVYTQDSAEHRAGDYQYTLLTNTNGDNSSEVFNYTVTNALNGTDSGNLRINIVDDQPSTSDVSQSLQASADPITTNLTIVLDISGSMDGSAGNGSSYLETAVAALSALIHEVDNTGNVNIQIVSFSNSASSTGWLVDDIATAISTLEGLIAGGGTNYAAALNAVMNSGTLPNADQSLLYFISDGEPSSGEDIDSTLQTTWENYLNNIVNDVPNGDPLYDIAFGIGIGNAELDDIYPIAYPNPNDVEEYAVQVDNADDLTSTILNYFEGNTITGNLGIINASSNNGVLIGADGGNVTSITIDGTTYVYDPDNLIQIIPTVLGGELTVNFETGSYSYSIDVDRNVLNQSENIQVTITDNDGDADSLELVLNINYYAGVDANVNNLISNLSSGSTIDIPVEYLTHGDKTPYSTEITNVTGDATLTNDIVTVANATNESNFNYQIDGNGASDSADVDFNFINSNQLIGGAGNDIIIAASSGNQLPTAFNAIVKRGDTYNTNGNNQIGFTFNSAIAGLYISNITINLEGGLDDSANFDTSDRFAIGSNTSGISTSNVITISNDESTLSANFDNNDFSNGDEFWFSIDTDQLSGTNSDEAGDFVTQAVTFSVTLSDGTTHNGAYVSDGNGGAIGTLLIGDGALLDGGQGDDVLVGGQGNDLLIGGDGNDLLIGGLGDDLLIGGAGEDIFAWQQNNTGTDTITDFVINQDTLDISDLLQTQDTNNLENYLSFNFDNGNTTIEIDTDGNGTIEQTIILDGVDLSAQYGTDITNLITSMLDDGSLLISDNSSANGNAVEANNAVAPLEENNGNIIP
ncbi:hypothetical protein G3R48_09425, partial [Shewanella intestini]